MMAPAGAIRDWLDFSQPGIVRVFTGKVELGQGIVTAIAQIAASVLEVEPARITIVSGRTRESPNEGYTGSSMSIETSGASVFRASVSARRLLLSEAERVLGSRGAALRIRDGTVFNDGGSSVGFWELARTTNFDAPVDERIGWGDEELRGPLIGRRLPRPDLPPKLTGRAFIHDIDLTDMLHARVIRPPSFGATLVSIDEAAMRSHYPECRLHIDGSFVAVVADDEYDAVRAAEGAQGLATWVDRETMPTVPDWGDYLRSQPALDIVDEIGELPLVNPARTVTATYSKPPIAHASVAPSCGVARLADGKMTVWSSSQGVFNLRDAIAQVLSMDPDDVAVVHAQSAGCYGHNGADDAAMEAALLARAYQPNPVRVQWTRADELAWSPFGTPMAIEIEASLSDEGMITAWRSDIWSGTHVRRPGFLPGLIDFVSAARLAEPFPLSDPASNPYAFAGSDRNSRPLYDVPHVTLRRHHLPDLPLRLSSLRALGGFANVFAMESFMDELAEAAKWDPVEFRLNHLRDERACAVVRRAVELGEWAAGAPSAGGRAKGMAFARYKETAAYVAVVAEVEIGDDLRLLRLSGAVDAGLAINPDGLLNQIEGGAIQAASWTLLEEVTFDSQMITSSSWAHYPIMRFGEAPQVQFDLVGGDRNPPLGAGEASQGPTAAAIANAIARALGARVRELPITRRRIIETVSK